MPHILVVREFDDFSRILSERGYAVINCSAIKTVALENLSDLTEKLKKIEIYDGVFLTSAAATEIFIEQLGKLAIKPRGVIYALGKRSFDSLKNAGLGAVFFAESNTAREMLEKIAAQDLQGKRFLFVRGEKSLRVVPDFLSEIAEVDEAIAYRTENIAIASDKIKELAAMSKKRGIECACFFSPSGAESFLEQCGTRFLHQIKVATIGRTTADFLEKRNVKVDFAPRRATAKDFAVELIEYLGKDSTAKYAESAKKEK